MIFHRKRYQSYSSLVWRVRWSGFPVIMDARCHCRVRIRVLHCSRHFRLRWVLIISASSISSRFRSTKRAICIHRGSSSWATITTAGICILVEGVLGMVAFLVFVVAWIIWIFIFLCCMRMRCWETEWWVLWAIDSFASAPLLECEVCGYQPCDCENIRGCQIYLE